MKYDWKTMTPRERDALVAEHVMGWTDIHMTQPIIRICGDYYGFSPEYEDWNYVPEYSVDISAAWTMIEKMKHTNAWEYGEVNLRWGNYGNTLTPTGPCGQMTYPNELAWVCAIDNEKISVYGIAQTVPEAICLAALKACGVEITV